MAVVDHANHAMVLGIVYDGPPEAGKTTSVRALARSFGRDVYTPEEQAGRTVYFDWLEHTGGRFDGAPIRCQIVSVPGQDQWLERRLHLLKRADVVVFVGDTSAAAWPATLARLHDLRARLDAREGPPIGVVFQANRRDAPDALDMQQVRKQVGSERVALVESLALDGTGVREAFVFAVRLALDRVREEQRLGKLPHVNVDQASTQVLQQLRELEPAPAPALAPASATQAAPATRTTPPPRSTATRQAQRLPSHDVPSGLVWPPVEGRILLREALVGAVEATLDASGDQLASLATGHRAHSPRAAVFAEVDEGRNMLIAWARLHVSAQPLLSKGRCLVLAGSGDNRFRLWQIVRSEPTLRELFIDGCETMIPRHAARQLATAARCLAEAQAVCSFNALSLACTLDTIGVSDVGRPVYVGDFPLQPASPTSNASSAELLARELADLLRYRSSDERHELCRELLNLQRRELGAPAGTQVGELLSQLLLQ